MVDYMGRGGITQAASGYVDAIRSQGWALTLLSRAGRELPDTLEWFRGVQQPPGGGAAAWHARLLIRTMQELRRARPDVLIIQNYWAPVVEQSLIDVAHHFRARVILVVHNHRPHARDTGFRAGLGRMTRRVDAVVTHSRYVADRIDVGSRPLFVLPLPDPLSLASGVEHRSRTQPPTCLHFGVLTHGYKGADLVRRLAESASGMWQFRLVGVGAGSGSAVLTTRDEFLPLTELASEVQAASLIALPYVAASQSGAIRVAQSLGRVAMASAVGGVPEQITDGVDGFLVTPAAGVAAWRARLAAIRPDDLDRMGEAARRRAVADDAAFRTGILAALEG